MYNKLAQKKSELGESLYFHVFRCLSLRQPPCLNQRSSIKSSGSGSSQLQKHSNSRNDCFVDSDIPGNKKQITNTIIPTELFSHYNLL
jgi:hypothetical protein